MRTSPAHLPERKQAAFADDGPKLHHLHKLRKRIGELDRRVLKGLVHHTDEQRRLFQLLADAYIHARYAKSYAMTRERSGYLVGRTRCRQAFGFAFQGA